MRHAPGSYPRVPCSTLIKCSFAGGGGSHCGTNFVITNFERLSTTGPPITSATLTNERMQHDLDPMELHRLQGISCVRTLPLRFGTSLFAPSEQETSMTTKTKCPSVLGPHPRWILCKSMTTTCSSTTSTLEGTRRMLSPSTPGSRVRTGGSGC